VIADNVASIEACPERVLSGHDRAFALHFARQGYDVYCFMSGGHTGAWCLWLADRRIPLGDVLPQDVATDVSHGP